MRQLSLPRQHQNSIGSSFDARVSDGNKATPKEACQRCMPPGCPARPWQALGPQQPPPVPYRETPALIARISTAEGIAARCLELAILCTARTSEVLLAEWSEFDLDAAVWTVPSHHMKLREAHTVYLSQRAVDLLDSLKQMGLDERLVFPSPVTLDRPVAERKSLPSMAMLTVLGRLGVRDRTTVHGLARATFITWANETAAARPDVIEACLAHEEANRVRAAYNRSEFAEERRALLAKWADCLAQPPAAVLPYASKAA
jgi:integrase